MTTIDGDDVNKDIVIMDGNDDCQDGHSFDEKKDITIKYTHHQINQLENGLNEGPDPFSVGLWVDGAIRHANGRAPRALLGVKKGPEQVLRAPPHRTELIANDELPDSFHDPNACSEELAKELCLSR